MSGVKCTSNIMKRNNEKIERNEGTATNGVTGIPRRILAAAVLILCMACFTGCGRAITNSYESVRASSEQINPMVTSQTTSVREKSFAAGLCLPEDTAASKNRALR